jgi:hypothetical protein
MLIVLIKISSVTSLANLDNPMPGLQSGSKGISTIASTKKNFCKKTGWQFLLDFLSHQ